MNSWKKSTGGDRQPLNPRNTLRLTEKELALVYRELTGRTGEATHARSHVRWDYHLPAVRIDIAQPGGTTTSLFYACRNLSSGGIGILHGSFLHSGTPCTVHLPVQNGGTITVDGTVIRCGHLTGHIHDVGIRFARPIDVRGLLDLRLMHGEFTLEHVDPTSLKGTVLHVDDSPMDRRLVRHFLSETDMGVVSAEDGAGALAQARENFDAVLCAAELPDMPGLAVAEKLRAAGVQCPIVLLSAEGAARDGNAESQVVNARIAKPLTKESLLRALAEFLVLRTGTGVSGGPIVSTLARNDYSYAFVPEFVNELAQYASELSSAVSSDDTAAALRLCAQIRSTSPSLGFSVIGEASEAALKSIKEAGGVAKAAKSVRALVAMCSRARAA